MRVLIAYGSTRGGTAGLASMIGDELRVRGVEAEVRAAPTVRSIEGYDAVVVAGALYASRWHRHARRFVRRHLEALRAVPVWLVSSGPLDESAREGNLPPVRQVARSAAVTAALGTTTFGGRLEHHARGFPAHAMARTHAGDWRDRKQVQDFAATIAAQLEELHASA